MATGNMRPPLEFPIIIDGHIHPTWRIWFQRVGTQASAQSTASDISSITVQSGSDQIDRAALNTALETLVAEVNAINTVVSGIVSALQDAEKMKS